MIDVDLERLKEITEEQEVEVAKIDGKLESINDQLNQLGFKNITEAKSFVRSNKRKLVTIKSEFNKKIKAFGDKYAKFLD